MISLQQIILYRIIEILRYVINSVREAYVWSGNIILIVPAFLLLIVLFSILYMVRTLIVLLSNIEVKLLPLSITSHLNFE